MAEQRISSPQRPGRTAQRKRAHRTQGLLSLLFSLAVAGCIVSFVFFLWLTPVRITGDSMAPGLVDGEIVLVDRLSRYLKLPGRGELVLVETTDGPIIKRIIGLPGEHVEIMDGGVYIDSRPLLETGYQVHTVGTHHKTFVPEGRVFLLGDNRQVVQDSRSPHIGTVSYGEIRGVVRLRIHPLSRLTLYY